MIKGKVLLGLLAGFAAGTMLGALFASTGSKGEITDKKKKNDPSKKNEEDDTIYY